MNSNQQKIVIVGATGLIGQQLVRNLIHEGLIPVVLTRNLSKAKMLFDNDVQIQYWNRADISSLTAIINNSKAVVNLVGESVAMRWTKRKKELILKSRIDTTNAIVNAINDCSEPPEVFIQASAIGYYPYNSSNKIDEDGLAGDGFLSNVVMQWEQTAAKAESKSRLIIIRTGIVLSTNGVFLKEILRPIKLFIGGWLGNGKQLLSWIHIDDHVRAIQFLIDNTINKGVYNLVSPQPISYKLFVKKIGKIINRPIWMPIPTFILVLLFGRMANEVLLSNQNIVPSKLLSAGFKFKYSDIDFTLNNLIPKPN
ncbi:MAG: TIGR01777 family protein [Bacteroidales bacterium]|nr:TIGR01777 family protein [Bacteroidales bacterium]